jgi:hypothetical protein
MPIAALLERLSPYWAAAGEESATVLANVERELGAPLPQDYKRLMAWSNGGETVRPLPYFKFYAASELLPRRADGQPPDVLEFATDDSDGLALDLAPGRRRTRVVSYPLGERTRAYMDQAASDLTAFLARQVLGRLEALPEKPGDTLFCYMDGSDLREAAELIRDRFRRFIEERDWLAANVWFVDQVRTNDPTLRSGDLPDWNLGLNLELAPPSGSRDANWFDDIAATVTFLRSLSTTTGRSFVIGTAGEDLFYVDARPVDLQEMRRHLEGSAD